MRQIIRLTAAVFGAWLTVMAPGTVTIALRLNRFADDGMPRAYSLMIAAGFLMSGVALIVAGRVSDGAVARGGDRRLPMLVALPAMAAAGVALAAAGGPVLLAIAWLVAQVAASALIAPAVATVGDLPDPARRHLASALISVTPSLALLVGGILVRRTGAGPAGFLVPALAGTLLAVPFVVHLPARRDLDPGQVASATVQGAGAGAEPVANAAADDGDRRWRGLLLAVALVGVSGTVVTTYPVAFVENVLGVAEADVVVVVTRAVVAATFAAIVAGILMGRARRPDRVRWTRRLVAATLVLGVGTAAPVLLPAVPVFLAASVLIGTGLGTAAAVSLQLAVRLRRNSGTLGRDLAVLNGINNIPAVAVPAVVPLALALGLHRGLVVVFGLAACVAVGSAVVVARTQADAPTPRDQPTMK